jgi:hypothetical protein
MVITDANGFGGLVRCHQSRINTTVATTAMAKAVMIRRHDGVVGDLRFEI